MNGQTRSLKIKKHHFQWNGGSMSFIDYTKLWLTTWIKSEGALRAWYQGP
jgi:hypothetical protein